jgi:transcriptional regulator with XRE-family HTH domain
MSVTAKPEGQAPERSAWKREAEVHDLTAKLGARLRELRLNKGLSLAAASALSGLAVGTLSRIENNKMAPTFGVVIKLVEGLGVPWSEVMGPLGVGGHDPALSGPAQGQVSVHRQGDPAAVAIRMNGIDYEAPHVAFSDSRLSPRFMTLNHRSLAEAGGLVGHPGTEFCLVLDGELDLHFSDRPTQRLAQGASAMFDAEIPHGYVSAGSGPVRVLCVLNIGEPSTGDSALLRRLGMGG